MLIIKNEKNIIVCKEDQSIKLLTIKITQTQIHQKQEYIRDNATGGHIVDPDV